MGNVAAASVVSPWRRTSSWLPGTIFAVLALELSLLTCALGWLVVVRISHPAPDASIYWQVADVTWGGLAMLGMLWGSVCLLMAGRGARRSNESPWPMIGSACACGVIVIAIHSVVIARVSLAGAPAVDVSAWMPAPRAPALAEKAVAEPGDAEAGGKWFAASCSSCHGVTGDGIVNMAPSLRGSNWLAAADEPKIARLIRTGRAADDPESQTGRVMPARGGNPFLTEQQIRDLAAWLADLRDAPAVVESLPDSGDAPPRVQLSHWVVPAPPAGPIGLAAGVPMPGQIATDVAGTLARDQRASLHVRAALLMGLSGLHLMHVLMSVAVGMLWLGGRAFERHWDAENDRRLFAVLWHAGTIAWLVMVVLLYT